MPRHAVLFLCAASALLGDTTFTFQSGAGGYSGARDFSINTQYAQFNGGNGVQWRGDQELGCYTTTGNGAYAVRYLLKFGDLPLPAGARVVSASLTISLDSWNNSSGNISGFYLRNAWNGDSNNLGWLHRTDTGDWAAPGASMAGVDTVAGTSFRVPPLRPVGVQTITIPLDANVVKPWVDSPAANQGFMLVSNNPGEVVNPVSTVGTPSRRPKLTVVIAAGSGVQISINPTSATLLPGATRAFSATVSGTANTSVTWSATGGMITPAGVYAAGNSVGSFTVTATSAADPSKSATATVTIQPIQISISVSPNAVALQPGQTQQFTATVTGTSNIAVSWGATGGTISSSGFYTAGTATGNFTITATSAAGATKNQSASVHINSVSRLPPVPRQSDGAYVVIQSPVTGMHVTAPGTIRIYADPFDGGAPDPDALTVNFLVNGQSVGTYTGSGDQNGYFPMTLTHLAAGTYVITAQIHTTGNATVVTSPPVTVVVDDPPATSGSVFNLTSDVVLSGSQSSSYAGTAGNHCVINGNGFQIRAAAGFTGSLTISDCDVRGLGSASKAAIDVTVNNSGSIQITGNVFDTFGEVSIGANDQAQAIVKNNEFRENTLVPVGSQPEDASTLTVPVFHAAGNSPVLKFFQGNNVGLSTVVFENVRNWLIGGDTDAESNVLMGVRCGFRISGSSGMVLRGNYSQHNYPHRFSQGENFQLDGDGFLAEHNVIRSSSWPLRGMGGELRYNLIDASGNSDEVLQGPMSNANIHHNIFSFTVSETLYSPQAGLNLLYSVDNVQFHNNVMDGGGTFMLFSGSPVAVTSGAFIGSLRNNVFYNFASPAVGPVLAPGLGESSNPPPARLRYSDYNDFYNPDAPNQTNYGLSVVGLQPGVAGYGMHDLGGLNGHVNPKFTQPTAIPFPFLSEDIWTRAKKVSDVLSTYRLMYSPAPGSPLIGVGDPQDGVGGNIGAVGNGEPADQFGKFGSAGAP